MVNTNYVILLLATSFMLLISIVLTVPIVDNESTDVVEPIIETTVDEDYNQLTVNDSHTMEEEQDVEPTTSYYREENMVIPELLTTDVAFVNVNETLADIHSTLNLTDDIFDEIDDELTALITKEEFETTESTKADDE